jgi:hypothetical protein
MVSQFAGSFGIVLGLIGTLILFKYGFPQPSFEEGVLLDLEDATPLPNGENVVEHNQKVREEKERYKHISQLALALIVTGFLFQFAALWL